MDKNLKIKETFEIIDKYKTTSLHQKIFKDVAELWGCGKNQVILKKKINVTRNGIKNIPAFNLFFAYNQSFSQLLKSDYQGLFNRDKTWNAVFESYDIFKELVKEEYSIIIDMDEQTVEENNEAITTLKSNPFTYKLCPYYIKIEVKDIINDFNKIRENDIIDYVSIFDGSSFKRIITHDFYIKAPFAVLRVSGGKTAPRYISYSTLGKCIEDITFGSDSKETKTLMARFSDPIYEKDKPIVKYNCEKNELENETAKNEYFGMQEYLSIVKDVENSFENISISPLFSDYVFLNERGAAGDIDITDTIAYVYRNNEKKKYLNQIAKYFNLNNDAYPIVFARNKMVHVDFKAILIHELSHFLAPEEIEPHGINFGITNDFLQLYLNNKLDCDSSFRMYNVEGVIDYDKCTSIIKEKVKEIKMKKLNQKIIEKIVYDIKSKILNK